ncbi:MAG TPA: hypothetical protein VM510_06205 [Caulifigura sp.]|nr:hypothetical protein [Caulifigura sp.]
MQLTQLPPRRAGFCLLASLGALSTAGISLSPDEAAEVELSGAANLSTGSARTSAAPPGPTDDELRTMILGRWQTVSNGTRVVENRPDGTASMDLTFDFVASLLYGDRMQIELTWFISDGLLVYTMQSGKPKSPFDRIVSNYGSQATYRFHSIAADRMHLVRQRDATESYVWTRIGTEKK